MSPRGLIPAAAVRMAPGKSIEVNSPPSSSLRSRKPCPGSMRAREGLAEVDRREISLAQQESVEVGIGIGSLLVPSHDLAAVVDAECAGENGEGDVDRCERTSAQQIAVSLPALGVRVVSDDVARRI